MPGISYIPAKTGLELKKIKIKKSVLSLGVQLTSSEAERRATKK